MPPSGSTPSTFLVFYRQATSFRCSGLSRLTCANIPVSKARCIEAARMCWLLHTYELGSFVDATGELRIRHSLCGSSVEHLLCVFIRHCEWLMAGDMIIFRARVDLDSIYWLCIG